MTCGRRRHFFVYVIFFVPPSQEPTTFETPTLSASTISRVKFFTPAASSFAAISLFSSSQGLPAVALVDTKMNRAMASACFIGLVKVDGEEERAESVWV